MPTLSYLTASAATIAALSIATKALPLPSRSSANAVTILTRDTMTGSRDTSFVQGTHDIGSSIYSMVGEDGDDSPPDWLATVPTIMQQDEIRLQPKDLPQLCRQVYEKLLCGPHDAPTNFPDLPEGVPLTDVLRHCVGILPPDHEVDSTELKAKLEEVFNSSNGTHEGKDQRWGAGGSIGGVASGLGAAALYFANRRQGAGGGGWQELGLGGKAVSIASSFISALRESTTLPGKVSWTRPDGQQGQEQDGWSSDSEESVLDR
jgi:hypothetical protein